MAENIPIRFTSDIPALNIDGVDAANPIMEGDIVQIQNAVDASNDVKAVKLKSHMREVDENAVIQSKVRAHLVEHEVARILYPAVNPNVARAPEWAVSLLQLPRQMQYAQVQLNAVQQQLNVVQRDVQVSETNLKRQIGEVIISQKQLTNSTRGDGALVAFVEVPKVDAPNGNELVVPSQRNLRAISSKAMVNALNRDAVIAYLRFYGIAVPIQGTVIQFKRTLLSHVGSSVSF
ncbi:hypothetical protein MIR68_001714 [Amoeboaphelidium protococcarum]|nr:hypothetical protein MIR68_001714 [Amoeboaphelidium protococcarum]